MISIIIPFYNESAVILSCLSSLASLTTTRTFEIVLVDNASTDDTVSKISGFTTALPLRIIREDRKGRGAARQAGFAAARGDICFSTDADAVVPPDWLDKLAWYLDRPGPIAVTGACKVSGRPSVTNRCINVIQPVTAEAYHAVFRHYWLNGFNFAITKKAYEASGGFDRQLNALEDIDLSMKVAKVGPIAYARKTSVAISDRRFRDGLVRGMLPYGTSFASYYFHRADRAVLSDVRSLP